jgi:hypothetical protein
MCLFITLAALRNDLKKRARLVFNLRDVGDVDNATYTALLTRDVCMNQHEHLAGRIYHALLMGEALRLRLRQSGRNRKKC